MPRLLYASEIMDVIAQLEHMDEHAAEMANSESGDEVKNALEDLETSLERLGTSVTTLRHRVGRHIHAPGGTTSDVTKSGTGMRAVELH